ncbi:MAG: nucleotidyltransferase [Lewinellaceae bacterium]|nr:nucleotidyltransferase [Lewinellaceae bacterium]
MGQKSQKPTLLVLAAGMGSRYGKLKQMDGFGPNNETIIEYSIYDAMHAGFGKVVFIIRDWFRDDFEKYFRERLGNKIEMEFVNQSLFDLPIRPNMHPDREKPWGTSHAIWVARNVINEPFGVINADDYYGVEAFSQLYDFLTDSQSDDEYAVIAYYLKNTLSDHGTVNRGVCYKNDLGHLAQVIECTKIGKESDGKISYPKEDGTSQILDENTLVSMNMWGFKPNYFQFAENMLIEFLTQQGHELTSEFYIPSLIDTLINEDKIKVKVIDTDSEWFGVTYQNDKPMVEKRIEQLIQDATYPANLWTE